MTDQDISIYKVGQHWIAHRDFPGHDCVDDNSIHGVADHPTAALRALLKAEDNRSNWQLNIADLS